MADVATPRASRVRRWRAAGAVVVCVILVSGVVSASAFDFDSLATSGTGGPIEDHTPMAAVAFGEHIYVAVRVEQRVQSDGPPRLKVFRIDPGTSRSTELASPEYFGAVDGGFLVGLDVVDGAVCVQFTVAQNGPRVSCFDSGSNNWRPMPSPDQAMTNREFVGGFTGRGMSMFVLVADLKDNAQRVLRLEGGIWVQVGQKIRGRNQQVAFNPPASASESEPTILRERSVGNSRGTRAILALRNGRWRSVSNPARSLYGAQSGPAARASHNWVIAETRGVPEIAPFGFYIRRYTAGRWQILRPGNLLVDRHAYPQGNVGVGSSGTTWVAWSEAGVPRNGIIRARVYASRILARRLTKPRRLSSGVIFGFPPLPQVVSAGGKTFAVFERPSQLEGTPTRVRLSTLDGPRTEITLGN